MKRLRSLVFLAITLLLLALVLRQVGINELLATLRQADPLLVIVAVLLSPLLILISVIKWQLLLRSQGDEVSFWFLFRLYYVGYFFNNFLPSTVGGDVVRVYELGNRTRDPAGALASVFMERLTGFVVLLLLAILALLGNLTLIQDTALTLAVLAVVVMFAGVLWVIFDRRLLDWMERVLPSSLLKKYTAKFRKFQTSLYAYKDRRRVLAVAFAWSVLYHVLSILNVYVCARAFYPATPLLGIAIIAPILSVVGMLPFSFNGVGVQEWAFVLLFQWLGLPPSVGLSAIFLIRAKTLIIVLLGGLFYPTVRLKAKNTVTSSAAD
ncbi:MAG: flippase-like domain-containing protein [Chloroflexi bacterium]|nr:flippase-like domain-containing protein [Chloroflexota bacterium]